MNQRFELKDRTFSHLIILRASNSSGPRPANASPAKIKSLCTVTDSLTETQQYNELCAWSLSRGDVGFVHQFVVDCWALQHATEETKPIGIVFPLVSLCLHLEHGYTGRQAQLAHMQLAKRRKDWPRIPVPKERARFKVSQILTLEVDAARDKAIDGWCAAAWEDWKDAQPTIRELVRSELLVTSK
jgi:hypothetical protein